MSHCPFCGAPSVGEVPWVACVECIPLPVNAYDEFAEMLDNPPPPNENLKRAMIAHDDLFGTSELITIALPVEEWQLVTSAVYGKSLEFEEGTLAERFWLDLYEKLQSFNK